MNRTDEQINKLKQLLWVLDSKHNVSVTQTEENINYITSEIVKLFPITGVSKSYYKDKKGAEIKEGSIVDIHQIVDGQRLFVVLEIEPLDIVYGYDLNRKYEYDKQELLDAYTERKEVEVVGNIYDFLANVL